LPGGAGKETKYFTPSLDGKPGYLFATRVLRQLPAAKNAAKNAGKEAPEFMPPADDLPIPPTPPTPAQPPTPQGELLPAPRELGKAAAGGKRIDTTYFRPSGRRWASETALLPAGSPSWEKSALSLYRDSEVNSLEWTVEEGSPFVLTHFRDDGKTK